MVLKLIKYTNIEDDIESMSNNVNLNETESNLKLLDNQTAQKLADLFKVLADSTRIKILSLLIDKRELRVIDIADNLKMGQSAISHQLRVLRISRLVKFRKDGKETIYSIDDDHVLLLIQQGLDHISHS